MIEVLKYFIVTVGIVSGILGAFYFFNEASSRDQAIKMQCLESGGIYSTAAANTCVWSKKAID